jgi:RecB family endonuclease NucS
MQNKEIKIYKSNNELYKIENYKDKDDFALIKKKIIKDAFDEEDEDEIGDIDFLGNFDTKQKVIYAYTSSDATITFVDDLNQFSENYRTEKEWKVEKWTEI